MNEEYEKKFDNRWLWIIGGGCLAMALFCACLAAVAGALLLVTSSQTSGTVEPISQLTAEVSFEDGNIFAVTEVVVEVDTTEPTRNTPVPLPATNTPIAKNNTPIPDSSLDTATPVPQIKNLDEVDLDVLREAWDFVQFAFDGPLPTQAELEQTIVDCSVALVTGDDEYFDLDATRTPLESFPAGQERPDNLDDIELDTYYATWSDLQNTYDGDLPTQEELRELTIACSIASLGDPFTRYIPPAVAARDREDLSGRFEGIGAFVRLNEDNLAEIVRPMDGQPADLAGLLAGDVVIGVDGEDVVGQSLDVIISKIRGPRGTVVVLTVQREEASNPIDITITRARIEIPIVESEMLDGDIAYIRLTSFSSNADEQVTEAMDELFAQNPKALIFDVRDNPGGFLNQAIAVTDLFVGREVILLERNSSGEEQTFRGINGDLAEEIPLVVLINAGSASASEILAGAIHDHERATLVGETTFGKGSVQQPFNLSDDGQINVTIARWYTPSNNTIDTQGVEPDIFVSSPDDFVLGGEGDTQLERAIEYLLTGE